MDTERQPSKIHPLLAVAAIAVIGVSLAGIAAMMGVIPDFLKTTPPTTVASVVSANNAAPTPPAVPTIAPETPAVAAEAPPPATLADQYNAPQQVAPAPAPTPAPQRTTRNRAPTYADNQYNQVRPAPAPICASCGTVISVRAIQHRGPTTGVGIVGGAVVGGLIGNQFGGGTGNTLATIAGAVGGGYAGNAIEKNMHTTTSYEVIVRMDNGSRRRFNMAANRWQNGDLVRVRNGTLVAR